MGVVKNNRSIWRRILIKPRPLVDASTNVSFKRLIQFQYQHVHITHLLRDRWTCLPCHVVQAWLIYSGDNKFHLTL